MADDFDPRHSCWEHGECSRYPRRPEESDIDRNEGNNNPRHERRLGGSGRRVERGGSDEHDEGFFREHKPQVSDDETTKWRQRRQRQTARETERMQRERQGLHGHYIAVDVNGIPYSFGVGAWRQEVNKLSVALDPSIMNVRY